MRVAVVVPWRGGCPHRERAWAWVRRRYAERHPDWELVEGSGPDPWVKAAAVMPVIAESDADVVIVADADVWCNALGKAVVAVRDGSPWAIPHGRLYRLTPEATDAVLDGGEPDLKRLVEPAYFGMPGGGLVVARREQLLEVPMDPRFVGWGQEDQSWGRALTRLAGGPWRGDADLIHLYHPPAPRLTRARGSREGWRLARRYYRARSDRALMQALIDEVKDVAGPETDQPAVRDLPARGVGGDRRLRQRAAR